MNSTMTKAEAKCQNNHLELFEITQDMKTDISNLKSNTNQAFTKTNKSDMLFIKKNIILEIIIKSRCFL